MGRSLQGGCSVRTDLYPTVPLLWLPTALTSPQGAAGVAASAACSSVSAPRLWHFPSSHLQSHSNYGNFCSVLRALTTFGLIALSGLGRDGGGDLCPPFRPYLMHSFPRQPSSVLARRLGLSLHKFQRKGKISFYTSRFEATAIKNPSDLAETSVHLPRHLFCLQCR